MIRTSAKTAQRIAHAARAYERQRTGHGPTSVSVVLCDDTLVLTVQGALSEAERALARGPDGAAQVQAFHTQLLSHAAITLRREIEQITGAKVCEVSAEIDPNAGTIVKVFTTGASVQIFLSTDVAATDVWSDSRAARPRVTDQSKPSGKSRRL
jgi:uncharacterized protein YbcI